MSAFTRASQLADTPQPNGLASIQDIPLQTAVELQYYNQQIGDWTNETGTVVDETPCDLNRERANVTVDTGDRTLYVTWNGCVKPALEDTHCQLGRWAALQPLGGDSE